MFQRRTSSVVIVDLIPLFRWTNLVLGGQLGGHVEADINTKNVSVPIAYCPSFVSRQLIYILSWTWIHRFTTAVNGLLS